ncbi:MAG: serine/threonine-protein kinase [Candidatus Paceibacterota bacterium]
MSKITLNDYYFDVNNKIGKGSSGIVFSGYHSKTKEKVAIKRVDINDLNKNRNGKNLKINKIWNEIEIMKELDHPNIIKLYDVYIDIKNEYLYLIMEFCDGGDLSDYINDYTLDLTQVKEFITSLKNGLEYLCSRGVVHRDLKPHNILIKKDHQQNQQQNQQSKLIIKIADFGLSAFTEDGSLMKTMCGSPLYMSPEIIEHQKYTAKSDLWSIGIIIYQLIYHRHPYENCKNYAELVKLIKTEPIKYPSSPPVDNLTIDLLQGLLDKNCHNRISWEDFFKHPWFKHPFGTNLSIPINIPKKNITHHKSSSPILPSSPRSLPKSSSISPPKLPSPPKYPPPSKTQSKSQQPQSKSQQPQSNNGSMDMDILFKNEEDEDEDGEIIESIVNEESNIDLSLYLVENYNRNSPQSNPKNSYDNRKSSRSNSNNPQINSNSPKSISRIPVGLHPIIPTSLHPIIPTGLHQNPVNPGSSPTNITSNSIKMERAKSQTSMEANRSSNRPIPKRNQDHMVDIYGTSAPECKTAMEYSPSSLNFSSMGTSILGYVSTSYDWIKNSIEF